MGHSNQGILFPKSLRERAGHNRTASRFKGYTNHSAPGKNNGRVDPQKYYGSHIEWNKK